MTSGLYLNRSLQVVCLSFFVLFCFNPLGPGNKNQKVSETHMKETLFFFSFFQKPCNLREGMGFDLGVLSAQVGIHVMKALN